ncbi:Glutaminase [Pseudarthrobacter chlorophenolicus A6]|uniref:Glutaminase n=1 Tax=Pseudarthrobacter chlorophenolicus (strain ATCC 700700 / DSM 12829 / CIP 107037 / JCM 12360 / KCTC 9906 / NCIMB 13794 / A6) TaxID=452863 RepID=B8H6Q2_PSECP|nr:glutaminase [Pseudarthrobacter chlorophenolicus]ACL41578.1 Glutaminase [Pseudarthrobacter chlorophenolicus A6]SDQ61793.1 L-glutaminase [Pseudarthrobacter chlorophenolicus]
MKNPIPDYLDEVITALRDEHSGDVAGYIPQLAQAEPNVFGAAITTVKGHTYAAGDSDRLFSIQSISKPFAYAAALIDRGMDRVCQTVGVEPSGEAFNELSLEGETHRPKNPMINAGAIATHSLVGTSGGTRTERLLEFFSALAGRELNIDQDVCGSEFEHAHRNLAIGHMLKNYTVLDGDVHDIVLGYTQQCSILVSAKDLSMMTATLAAGGVQPLTGERLMEPGTARQVMAVMAGAGMYDFAGEWLTKVGIPAKSGVSGGMIGVLPNQVGISAFSPRLDSHGNSHRGRLVFERLSADMGMHLFGVDQGNDQSVAVEADGQDVTYHLYGTVQFLTAADLLHRMSAAEAPGHAVIDASRVDAFTDVGRRMTLEGMRRLNLDGWEISLRDPFGRLPDPDFGDGNYPSVIEHRPGQPDARG